MMFQLTTLYAPKRKRKIQTSTNSVLKTVTVTGSFDMNEIRFNQRSVTTR